MVSQEKIQIKDGEKSQTEKGGHLELGQKGDQKDALVADLLEPPPVRQHFDAAPNQRQQNNGGEKKYDSNHAAEGRQLRTRISLCSHLFFSLRREIFYPRIGHGEKKYKEVYQKAFPDTIIFSP
jgi:hypothetical protein